MIVYMIEIQKSKSAYLTNLSQIAKSYSAYIFILSGVCMLPLIECTR